MKPSELAAWADDHDCEILTMPEYADALVGIVEYFGKQPVALYSRQGIIDQLSQDMTPDEAEEYFDFNIGGAYCGEGTPAFLITP